MIMTTFIMNSVADYALLANYTNWLTIEITIRILGALHFLSNYLTNKAQRSLFSPFYFKLLKHFLVFMLINWSNNETAYFSLQTFMQLVCLQLENKCLNFPEEEKNILKCKKVLFYSAQPNSSFADVCHTWPFLEISAQLKIWQTFSCMIGPCSGISLGLVLPPCRPAIRPPVILILKVKYLSNYFCDLPQPLNLSLYGTKPKFKTTCN
jgi:hypothetical protein